MQRCNCERMRDNDIKFIYIISIVTIIYSNNINLKILMSHWKYLATTFKLSQASCIVLLDDIRIHKRFPPQISASVHKSDFAPYVLGSYNAQWNAPKLPHDKHMSHLSCILGEMEVEISLLGLWLPLHY